MQQLTGGIEQMLKREASDTDISACAVILRLMTIIMIGILLSAPAIYMASTANTNHLAALSGNAYSQGIMKVMAALLAATAGVAFIMRYQAIGNRKLLWLGLTFFGCALLEGLHALLMTSSLTWLQNIQQWFSHKQFTESVDISSRLLLAIGLVASLFYAQSYQRKKFRCQSAIWGMAQMLLIISLLILLVMGGRYVIHLVKITWHGSDHYVSSHWLKNWSLSHLVVGISLLFALLMTMGELLARRDITFWWVGLSLLFQMSAQHLLVFSQQRHDAAFELAHIYGIFCYLSPLAAFTLHQLQDVRRQMRLHELAYFTNQEAVAAHHDLKLMRNELFHKSQASPQYKLKQQEKTVHQRIEGQPDSMFIANKLNLLCAIYDDELDELEKMSRDINGQMKGFNGIQDQVLVNTVILPDEKQAPLASEVNTPLASEVNTPLASEVNTPPASEVITPPASVHHFESRTND